MPLLFSSIKLQSILAIKYAVISKPIELSFVPFSFVLNLRDGATQLVVVGDNRECSEAPKKSTKFGVIIDLAHCVRAPLGLL